MKRKSKKDYYLKNSLKINFLFSILILSMAIFWNLFCANQLKYKEEFLKNAERTTATITNIEYRSEIKRDEIEDIYIEYFVNNTRYTGELKEKSSDMYVGEEIYIFYNLENPSDFIQNDIIQNTLFKYAGYLFLCIGILAIIYSFDRWILYLETLISKEIKAKVVGVIEKNSFFHKSMVIKCQWIDEKGEEYIFYSKPFNAPYFKKEFEKMEITELPVRFKNKKRYIVITEKIDKKLMV